MASGRSDEETLADVVRRVEPAAVAERMVGRFRSQISGYRRLPEPVVLGQILAISRRNVELFFRSILEGREPSADELEPFRDSARDRAGEGMPLEDLLHAYRLGGRIGWQAVVDAADPDERASLLLGAERLMDYVDRVSSVVAQAYLDERQHLVSEEERRLRDLFEVVCSGAPLRPSLRELAERLRFPLADVYRPFAETSPGAAAYSHAQLAATLRSRGVLALTEGERVAGLAPVDVEVRVDGALVAVGEPTPRSELAEALDELRLLLDLGRRLGRSGQLKAEDLAAELLLARSPRLATLLEERTLGPLEGARRGTDLIGTLEAYLAADLDRRRAAQALHVHPNTLDYRLKKVTEATGLDVGRVDDVVLLSLAMRQRGLGARHKDGSSSSAGSL